METISMMRFLRGALAPRSFLSVTLALALLAACEGEAPFFYDFEKNSDLDRLHWKCKTVFSLSEDFNASGSKSIKVEFYPDLERSTGHYPGLTLSGFDGHWSGHGRLAIEAYNPEDTPIKISIRIDDREEPAGDDWYYEGFLLSPGSSSVIVPFERLVTAAEGRSLDLSRIETVILYMANPKERHTLYFDRIRLE